jgi:hypothetical protein
LIRKLIAIIVLVMVASLSIAGCITNNSNQTPSATSSAAIQHDAFLETYLAAYKNVIYASNSTHVKAWELDWINSTSARLQLTELNKSTNATLAWDAIFKVFPTTQDATNYVNTMNLTAYSLASTEYPSGGAYQNVTGHAPQIYKAYVSNEINRVHWIEQLDNIVCVYTTTRLS